MILKLFQRVCCHLSIKLTSQLGMTTASFNERVPFKKNTFLKVSSILFFSIWSWTLIDVADMVDWTLENLPVFLLIGALVITYKKFQFSDLSYVLIFIYLAMHVYGAKYTYAENPFGHWLREIIHTERNHYDRIVHFSFGLLISYSIREVCLNFYKFTPRISIYIPIVCSLALGALYEIVEGTIVGVFFPEQGVNFLGIQGDIWDPQKDIFLGFFGSLWFGLLLTMFKISNRELSNKN